MKTLLPKQRFPRSNLYKSSLSGNNLSKNSPLRPMTPRWLRRPAQAPRTIFRHIHRAEDAVSHHPPDMELTLLPSATVLWFIHLGQGVMMSPLPHTSVPHWHNLNRINPKYQSASLDLERLKPLLFLQATLSWTNSINNTNRPIPVTTSFRPPWSQAPAVAQQVLDKNSHREQNTGSHSKRPLRLAMDVNLSTL